MDGARTDHSSQRPCEGLEKRGQCQHKAEERGPGKQPLSIIRISWAAWCRVCLGAFANPSHSNTPTEAPGYKLSGKMEFQIPWLAFRIKEIFYHKKLSVWIDASQKTGIALADSKVSAAELERCFVFVFPWLQKTIWSVLTQHSQMSALPTCVFLSIVLINVLLSYSLSLNFWHLPSCAEQPLLLLHHQCHRYKLFYSH